MVELPPPPPGVGWVGVQVGGSPGGPRHPRRTLDTPSTHTPPYITYHVLGGGACNILQTEVHNIPCVGGACNILQTEVHNIPCVGGACNILQTEVHNIPCVGGACLEPATSSRRRSITYHVLGQPATSSRRRSISHHVLGEPATLAATSSRRRSMCSYRQGLIRAASGAPLGVLWTSKMKENERFTDLRI